MSEVTLYKRCHGLARTGYASILSLAHRRILCFVLCCARRSSLPQGGKVSTLSSSDKVFRVDMTGQKKPHTLHKSSAGLETGIHSSSRASGSLHAPAVSVAHFEMETVAKHIRCFVSLPASLHSTVTPDSSAAGSM